MQVERLMTTVPRCCDPGDSLDDVAQLMWDADCGALPVCAGDGSKRVLDMITDRDICMAAHFQRKRLAELTVTDVLSSDRRLQTCQATDSAADAERIMREARVRRLPVVNDGGVLVGMISLADLAREAGRGKQKKAAISHAEVGDTLAAICQPARQVTEPEATA